MRTPGGPIVTLTTDFGTRDPYVGSMKGVILSIHPAARVIDVTHELPPHQVLPAALLLREVCPRFPPGTIHVAVIDPGVGGRRRPVLLEIDGRFYVGPDNGIFGLLLRDFPLRSARRLENPEFFLSTISRTFHGRDIFAPVAAHLARGTPPERMGPLIDDPTGIALPEPRVDGEGMEGEIVWIDRFGNCVTNLAERAVLAWARGNPVVVRASGRRIGPPRSSYEEVPAGEPLALFNSLGFLEIACNRDRADRLLGLGAGEAVYLEKGRGNGSGPAGREEG